MANCSPYHVFVLEIKGPVRSRSFRFYNPVTCKLQWAKDSLSAITGPFKWLSAVLLNEKLTHYSVLEEAPFKDGYFLFDQYIIEDVIYTPPTELIDAMVLNRGHVYCPHLGRVSIIGFDAAKDLFAQMPDTAFEVKITLMPWDDESLKDKGTVWGLKFLYGTSDWREKDHLLNLPWSVSTRPRIGARAVPQQYSFS
uniref:SPATA6 domain-containing protein n=1 Tax=Steinernema glaseri TaxID=37863 RepID=A0A1I7Z922_9BILA